MKKVLIVGFHLSDDILSSIKDKIVEIDSEINIHMIDSKHDENMTIVHAGNNQLLIEQLHKLDEIKPMIIKEKEREPYLIQKKIHPKHQNNNKYRKH